MSQTPTSQTQVKLQFQAIKLPPVRDILVLGRKHPHGKVGVMECFRFIAPDEFEMFDVPDGDEVAEAVLINKRVLTRLSPEDILQVLRKHVFPFIASGEAINVDFDIVTTVDGITVA